MVKQKRRHLNRSARQTARVELKMTGRTHEFERIKEACEESPLDAAPDEVETRWLNGTDRRRFW